MHDHHTETATRTACKAYNTRDGLNNRDTGNVYILEEIKEKEGKKNWYDNYGSHVSNTQRT